MSVEEIKALVSRLYEAFDEGSLDAFSAFIDTDFVAGDGISHLRRPSVHCEFKSASFAEWKAGACDFADGASQPSGRLPKNHSSKTRVTKG